MPTYEYRCRDCGKKFSKSMTLREHERTGKPPCPKCDNRKVDQLPSLFQASTSKKA